MKLDRESRQMVIYLWHWEEPAVTMCGCGTSLSAIRKLGLMLAINERRIAWVCVALGKVQPRNCMNESVFTSALQGPVEVSIA